MKCLLVMRLDAWAPFVPQARPPVPKASRIRRRFSTPASLVVAVAVALVAGACTGGNGGVSSPAANLDETGSSSVSLSAGGREQARAAGLDEAAPRYRIHATLEPATGVLEASMIVEAPVADPTTPLQFRVFPNLEGVAPPVTITAVSVEGDPVDALLDQSLLDVPLPGGVDPGDRVTVAMGFAYTVAEREASSSLLDALGTLAGTGGLSPAEAGLLNRHPGGVALGHWYPTLLAGGGGADPEPGGFGDIGNFPAAHFTVALDLPAGWQAVTSGVTKVRNEADGRTVTVEEGAGLRDFAVYVGQDLRTATATAGDVAVPVSAAGDLFGDAEVVGAHTAAALTTLADVFGPYPWSELDVVAVPLAAAVGGMEWPGMIWISTEAFAGGVPGLGDLGGLESLLGDLGSVLGGAGGLGGGGLVEEAVSTTREFVIAHEVAHEWWHALVGNDSITAPAVDEPLAQFSACLYWERVHGVEEGRRVCGIQVDLQYQTMRALGVPDAPADQPSDAFASSLQYAGVVYGKAPGFYRAARDVLGDDALLAGLRAFATEHAFGLASPGDLLGALTASAPPGQAGTVEHLWDRWMTGTQGDADVGVEPPGGLGGLFGGGSPGEGLEGLEGLGGLEGIGDLSTLFEELFGALEEAD